MSGLIAPDGAPGAILEAMRAGRFDVVMSWELAEEIIDVLARPRLQRYGVSADDVADALATFASLLPRVDIPVEVRDADDVPVVAAALAGRAQAIVTGDNDLLADERLRDWLADRGVAVLTPSELRHRLEAG